MNDTAGFPDATRRAAYRDAVRRLARGVPKGMLVSFHRSTGALRYVAYSPDTRLTDIPGLGASLPTDPAGRSAALLQAHSNAFGISHMEAQVELAEIGENLMGGTYVDYQQVHQTLPVFAAAVRVHLGARGQPTVIEGLFVPDIDTDTTAAISLEQASRAAQTALRQQFALTEAAPVEVLWNDLLLYPDGLLRGRSLQTKLIYAITLQAGPRIKETFLVDAHSGKIVEQITSIRDARRRIIRNAANTQTLRDESTLQPSPYPGVNQLFNYAGHVFDAFWYTFGRNSFNNNGAALYSIFEAEINNNPACDNAWWDGVKTNFCRGYEADDVVAHEWMHAYTQYASSLIYKWQSGAIDEGLSDIFGETIDLINSDGDLQPKTVRLAGQCANDPGNLSARWLIGNGGSDLAPLRDLWTPRCMGYPQSVADPNYFCGSGDNGGVHINSTVIGHAFALLADGFTLQGRDYTGLGLSKAAHIYWLASHEYHHPSTDFSAHADALEAACAALTGVEGLPPLSTSSLPAFDEVLISSDDCRTVAAALQLVEMRTTPRCQITRLLQSSPPPVVCANGPFSWQPTTVFADSFEMAPLNQWTLENAFAATVSVLPPSSLHWVWKSGGLPGGRLGGAMFAENLGGIYGTGSKKGLMRLVSPLIVVPAGSGALTLLFDHWIATEEGYDGGNLSIQVNNGEWRRLERTDFIFNAYNIDAIKGTVSENPLAGEPAFSGTDNGSLQGSWGQSQISLARFAHSGDSLRLRFQLGMDSLIGVHGWYVDNVALRSCVTLCGDGVMQGTEACDDGDTLDDGNGCSELCENNSMCGNGVVEAYFEECDDGDDVDSGNGCTAACRTTAVCGNGVVESYFEGCDDGNQQDSGNGCSTTCQSNHSCGNGHIEALFETCDDANTVEGDGCDATCHRESAPPNAAHPEQSVTPAGTGTAAAVTPAVAAPKTGKKYGSRFACSGQNEHTAPQWAVLLALTVLLRACLVPRRSARAVPVRARQALPKDARGASPPPQHPHHCPPTRARYRKPPLS